MSNESEKFVLAWLAETNASPEVWDALTYDSGPYDVATPRVFAARLVAAAMDCRNAEVERLETLCLRWLRKWQAEMDPTPEMLEDTHALIRDERK